MKTHILSRMLVLFFLIAGWITVKAQGQMEVPGDNFSLEGALEVFKQSSSPQEFEKLLNNPETKVNNLDLNGDGYIDYIRVIDRNEGNIHVFIMQAIITERESQDIAVITLEKLENGKAVLQITGDEDIYGVETIIEPTREVRMYGGTRTARVVVNVWAWPSVQYIYSPYYTTWVSPWGWYARPVWWFAWRPVAYYNYYPYWHTYRHHYTVCYTHRVVYAEHIYRPHRTTSVVVHNRHQTQIVNYRTSRSDISSRERNDSYRTATRQNSTPVRYDANGRISSGSNSGKRSYNSRNIDRNKVENSNYSRSQQNASANRSSSDLRSSTPDSRQSESRSGMRQSSNSWSETRSNSSENQREKSVMSTERSATSGSNSTQRYDRGSSNSSNNGRTYSSSESSGSTPNVQRSSSSSNVQRSSGNSSVQRSSGNSNVQRSTGSSNVQRSSSSSNAERSTVSPNVQRSSSSSNVQRSTASPNVQRSSSSSNAQRSTGSSGARQSSDSSNEQKRGRQ